MDRNEIGIHPPWAKSLTLRNSYLLFTADFDEVSTDPASSNRYFAVTYRTIPDLVRSVWAHCWGFDAVDSDQDFAALGSRCRCGILREFIDCPDESLRSVLTSLTSQRYFVDLVHRRMRGETIDADSLSAALFHPPLG